MHQYNCTCFYSYDFLCRLISFIQCFNVMCCYHFYKFFPFFSQEKYDQIPAHIESKLLPFQRDGVRYVAVASLSDQCYISCIKHYVFVATSVNHVHFQFSGLHCSMEGVYFWQMKWD